MADFKNLLRIDLNTNYGDYQSITAALAAISGSVSLANPYTLWLAAHQTFTGDLTVPAGVLIIGHGPRTSVIAGKVDIVPGVTLSNLRIINSSSTAPYLLRYTISSTTSIQSFVNNCSFQNTANVNGTVSVVECEGTTAAANRLNIRNCELYGNAQYLGVNSGAALNALIRLKAGFEGYCEVWNSHLKTSVGALGTSKSVAALVETVAPSTAFGYVHLSACAWDDIYGGNGTAPKPELLNSVNTVHQGLQADVSYLNQHHGMSTDPAVAMPNVVAASTPYGFFYSRDLRRTRIWSGASLHSAAGESGYYPSVYASRAPTVADALPDGTEWSDTSTTLYESGNPPSSFRAYVTSAQSIATGAAQVVIFGTEEEDTRTEYNPATGVFTASTSGTYRFEGALYWSDALSGQRNAYFYKNGAESRRFSLAKTASVADSSVLSAQIKLNAGDTVDVRVTVATAATVAASTSLSWFAGTKLF